MNIILNRYVATNIVVSIVILTIVYVLQYIFNLAPCDMCINERYPYFLIITFGVINFLIKSKNKISELIIKIFFAVIYFFGFLYSLYHVGIERKFWIGSSDCSIKNTALDIETLSSQIMQTPVIRCDEPTILLNLISIAELNSAAMGILLLFSLIVLYKKI